MALTTCTFASTSLLTPAKILRSQSNSFILHTTCIILHPSSSIPSFSYSFRNSNFGKPFSNPLRATIPQKYVYPDPIPEFAEAETKKFRAELLKKLTKDREAFEEDLDEVVNVCSEIFCQFLHKEYGGPGTLLVEPFTDMLVALKEKKLAGAPLAARASLLWAQNYVDRDWEIWNSKLE